MGIFDLFGKKLGPSSGIPYSLRVEVHPMRMPAHHNDYIELEIDVRNEFAKELLTSVVLKVPKTVGFERSALSNEREIRLGNLAPGESKHLKVQLWSTQRTVPGNYHVRVYAISHYQNYGYVLNEVKKELIVRAG